MRKVGGEGVKAWGGKVWPLINPGQRLIESTWSNDIGRIQLWPVATLTRANPLAAISSVLILITRPS